MPIMARVRRPSIGQAAALRTSEQLARLGRQVREARLRRRWTQARLGGTARVSRMLVSRIERGLGGSSTVDSVQRISVALGIPMRLELGRDPVEDTADAGHLAMQELVLRIGRATGCIGSFELPTRPAEPWRSIDVVLACPQRRTMILCECWNTIGDIGAAARATSRKAAELDALAASRFGPNASVGTVWIIRATARNRALVARYPEVFASRFPGSSRGWVDALTGGGDSPTSAGLVWCDIAATRIFAWRRSRA
jgi:transcriptional regulator with XRE-family HTH domain